MTKYDVSFEVEAEDIQDALFLVYQVIDKHDDGDPGSVSRLEITEQQPLDI